MLKLSEYRSHADCLPDHLPSWAGHSALCVVDMTRVLLILAIIALAFAHASSEGPVLRKVLGVILGFAIAATFAGYVLSFFGFSCVATF